MDMGYFKTAVHNWNTTQHIIKRLNRLQEKNKTIKRSNINNHNYNNNNNSQLVHVAKHSDAVFDIKSLILQAQ